MKSSLRCKQQEIWDPGLVACLDLPEQLLNCHGTVSRYRVVIKVVFTSQHNCEHYQKKCRNKKEKSFKMKRDVGMACQKSAQTRKDKSDGKYTKPNSYIFTLVKRCRDG